MEPSLSTAQDRYREMLRRFRPEIEERTLQCLDKMRELLPGALEMVYDNYNGLVVGFCPTTKPSEAVFSLVSFPKSVPQ